MTEERTNRKGNLNYSLDELIQLEAPRKQKQVPFKRNRNSSNQGRKVSHNNFRGKRWNLKRNKMSYNNGIRSMRRYYFREVPNDNYQKESTKEVQNKGVDLNFQELDCFEVHKMNYSVKSENLNKLFESVAMIHNNDESSLQITKNSHVIISVHEVTGVLQLDSHNDRSESMLNLWNLFLKPLGLIVELDDNGSWSLTDGSCYFEKFKDGMIVRGSGSRDISRGVRASILEQHIKQLLVCHGRAVGDTVLT
ncbi:hypothetical protein cand_032170 [Cryptosporidium andersoni]|uniref:Uncharacterized protein n=1 Tax=Cryptosporidium andersoni TaxID=117008 RepID=A0A1J4MBA3_9CRYT|nr:hypothetical protein cand_032170 [Cryptosporidium andersoni]